MDLRSSIGALPVALSESIGTSALVAQRRSGVGANSRRIRNLWLAVTLATAMPAAAQDIREGASVLNLPRPGYEPRRLRLGRIVVSPEVLGSALYDSNIFAAPTDEQDDFVFNILPRVGAKLDRSTLSLAFDAYLNHRAHAENGSEDATTFGLGAVADYAASKSLSTNGVLRFDRTVESRADPEASLQPKPAKIDNALANLGFAYRRNRIGISGQAEAQDVNYLAASERDRDLASYRGSVGVSLLASARFEAFVEAFANRRDFRTAVDRSGVDRDATTLGVLAGTRIDIAGRWKGKIGLGAFRANPDDPTLLTFSGVHADANLTWWPNPRTLFSVSVRSGDVATVRAGASGRIDTSVSLRWEQEVRHNLLLRMRGGLRETRYRGGNTRKLRQSSIGGELEYLLNNQLSLLVNANYVHRSANVAADRFDRSTVGLGAIFRY